jgi:hypothetical protein
MLLIAITAASLALALVMSAVAWKLARNERRRSEARVRSLAAAIHRDFDVTIREDVPQPAPAATARADREFSSLFDVHHAPRSTASRLVAAVVVGTIVVGLAATSILMLSRGSIAHRSSTPAASTPAAAAPSTTPDVRQAAASDRPLELVALTHDRDGGKLIVRGTIRNPATSREIDGLVAVVFLFASDGAFIGSGRAPVGGPTLAPGADTLFAVSLPGADRVARYRVSFRTAQRVVPHVDRRERGPASPIARLQ